MFRAGFTALAAQLLALVKKHGVGEWQAKAAAFATERSSSALRHRWSCYLAAKTGSVAAAPKKESMPPPAPLLPGGGVCHTAAKGEREVTKGHHDDAGQRVVRTAVPVVAASDE